MPASRHDSVHTNTSHEGSLQITGSVERVRFRADSGFSVIAANIRSQNEQDDDATLVGVMPVVEVGDTFQAQVTIEEHKEYGPQYRVVHFILETIPTNLSNEGIAAYLQARVHGVGKVLANRITKAFGSDTFDILEHQPDRLLEISGITQNTLCKIKESWSEQGLERRALAGLQGLGLNINQAQQAMQHFGDDALQRVTDDLFALTDIQGIGFLTVDKLWHAQGGDPHDLRRLVAAAVYTLQIAAQQTGHSYLPKWRAAKGVAHYTRLSSQEAPKAIQEALEQGKLQQDGVHARLPTHTPADVPTNVPTNVAPAASETSEQRIYLPPLLQTEQKLAQIIRIMLATPPSRKGRAWQMKERYHSGLSTEQVSVIDMLEHRRLVVLTGGPGTGKSTTTRAIVDLAEDLGLALALCAPTGKAARRLSEVTDYEAKTIHRLLGYGPTGFKYNHLDPVPFDLFIVDEVSMLGDQLLFQLLSSIPTGSRVLLVGDVEQLPPLQAGLPLQALTKIAPTVQLTQVYRQTAGHPIIQAAHDIQNGNMPKWQTHPEQHPTNSERLARLADSQLTLTETNSDNGAQRIAQMVKELGGPRQVQVLTPMRKGGLGVDRLNQELQTLFNPLHPSADQQAKITRISGAEVRIGDSVVQTKNDYQNEVFNGTQGIVLQTRAEELVVDFDGHVVQLQGAELFNLQLGYALTVHRAQGSEWPTVLLALHQTHMPMLTRNLVYTALTRARERFFAVGSADAWRIAIKRQREERYSALLERIADTT